jgi:glycosyltransferase involved in cell wall biosynthesis
MSDTTVVIPLRNRGGIRLQNCLTSLVQQVYPPAEIILSDLGSTPEYAAEIRTMGEVFGARYVGIDYYDPKFNRAVAVNCGVIRASCKNTLVLDVDCLLHPRGIQLFEINLRPRLALFAEHHRVDCPKPGEDLGSDWYASFRRSWFWRSHLAFGMFMGAQTDFWKDLHGIDERFVGWGGEDDHFAWKAQKLGAYKWIDSPIMVIHQEHDEGTAGGWNAAEQERNHKLLSKLTRGPLSLPPWGRTPILEDTGPVEMKRPVSLAVAPTRKARDLTSVRAQKQGARPMRIATETAEWLRDLPRDPRVIVTPSVSDGRTRRLVRLIENHGLPILWLPREKEKLYALAQRPPGALLLLTDPETQWLQRLIHAPSFVLDWEGQYRKDVQGADLWVFGDRTTELATGGPARRRSVLYHEDGPWAPADDKVLLAAVIAATKTYEPATLPADPLVSVMILSHNRPGMLKEAVQSVLEQTYRHFEVVVVDDSDEDMVPVLGELRGGPVRIIHSPDRMTLAAKRQLALERAVGDVVVVLDDDDQCHAQRLEKVVQVFTKYDVAAVFHDAHGYTATGEDRGLRTWPPLVDFSSPFRINTIGTAAYRRDLALDVGYPKPGSKFESHGEDWDLLSRLLKVHPRYYYIQEALVSLRYHGQQTSSLNAVHSWNPPPPEYYGE